MSTHDESNSRYDVAIDDVAASLTRGEPRADMHAAIRASMSIDSGARQGGLVPGWYAGLAAVVAIVVVIVLVWPNREAGEGVSTPATDVAPVVPAPSSDEPSLRADTERIVSGSPGEPEKARLVSTAASRAAAASTTEPPLEIAPLDVMRLDVEPLDIQMIAVDALDVDPLVMPQ